MRNIIGFSLFFFLISCAALPPPEPSVENKINNIYLSRNFDPKALETDGIAILPMPVKIAPEGIRNNAIFEIQQAMQIYFPKARIVKKDEMVTNIRNAGMNREFDLLIKGLSENKTVDRSLLSKVGEIGKARFLLYAEIKEFKTNSTNIYNSDIIKIVEIEAEILDVRCPDPVWKGSGSTKVVESVNIDKIRMEEIFVNATKNLISSLATADKAEGREEVKACF